MGLDEIGEVGDRAGEGQAVGYVGEVQSSPENGGYFIVK